MATALRDSPDFVTEAEFLSLPESMDRIELLDGEVIVSPAPTPLHQYVLNQLQYRFTDWIRANAPAALGQAPLDVRFAPNRILQPDLFLVLQGFSPFAPSPLTLVPDLVVEVVSHRRSYDRITKRSVYADAGVREYWIVDPGLCQIEVISGLRTLSVCTEGELESLAAPGLRVALAEVFPR